MILLILLSFCGCFPSSSPWLLARDQRLCAIDGQEKGLGLPIEPGVQSPGGQRSRPVDAPEERQRLIKVVLHGPFVGGGGGGGKTQGVLDRLTYIDISRSQTRTNMDACTHGAAYQQGNLSSRFHRIGFFFSLSLYCLQQMALGHPPFPRPPASSRMRAASGMRFLTW
ncbi:hypothetical protein LX36DRAFT_403668 [Colletotrichum falcatum]|nr:hypothetical protein LX36DRAFT_403668 [Colletotrichum falcatum]